jgi:hypothetical protein
MTNQMKKIAYTVFILLMVISCKNKDANKRYLPNATGKAGELLIVIESEHWASNLGDSLKYTLAQSQIALPQPEPLFTLINIPPDAFNNIFKLHRNILYVRISPEYTKTSISFQEEKWANYQLVFYYNAPSAEAFLEDFQISKNKIISKILEKERERTMRTHKRLEEIGIRQDLIQNHKIALTFPQGFRIDVDSANFVWVSHTEPDVDQGVLVYYYPYLDESELDKENLISKRNEILQKHVHGSASGSYMTTEDLVPVYYNTFYKENGLYIAELRGLWKLEKGFMGGPFISHTTIDTVYNRIVTVDGYVFAPNRDKRNLIRQVEAILRSLQITK